MYVEGNPKTKKELRQWVEEYCKDPMSGRVRIFASGLGKPKENGWDFVEGPHYPQPHRWYAQVRLVDGAVVEVKK